MSGRKRKASAVAAAAAAKVTRLSAATAKAAAAAAQVAGAVDDASATTRAAAPAAAAAASSSAAHQSVSAAAAAGAGAGNVTLSRVHKPLYALWRCWDGATNELAPVIETERIYQPALWNSEEYRLLTTLVKHPTGGRVVDVQAISKCDPSVGWGCSLSLPDGVSYREHIYDALRGKGMFKIAVKENGDTTLEWKTVGKSPLPLARMTATDAMLAHMRYQDRPAGGFAKLATNAATAEAEFKKVKEAQAHTAKTAEAGADSDAVILKFAINNRCGPGYIHAHYAKSTDRLSDLKRFISNRFNIPSESLYLFCDGAELAVSEERDPLLAVFSSLEKGCTVHAIQCDEKPQFPPTFEYGTVLRVDDKYERICDAVVLEDRGRYGGDKDGDVYIRYTKWSSKYNEWIPCASPRIRSEDDTGRPAAAAASADAKRSCNDRTVDKNEIMFKLAVMASLLGVDVSKLGEK